MKKITFLLACLMLVLCACGGPEQTVKPETTTAQVQTEPQEIQAPETQVQDTEMVPVETEAVTETTEGQDTLLDLAQTCIDKSVEELYALIGEPKSSDYAPSCLGDGDDGNLYYDGFIVYTYREGDVETVRYVE